MHSGHRLYSDFFWSGIQGMADPSDVPPPSHLVPPHAPLQSRRRQSFLGIPNLLASSSSSRSTKEDVSLTVKAHRRISSLLPSSAKENDKEYATRPPAKPHRRISSILPNPPKKWFSRTSRPVSPSSSSSSSYHPMSHHHHHHHHHHPGDDEATSDTVDLWITAGGPFVLTNGEGSSSDVRASDRFTSFPEPITYLNDALDDDDNDDGWPPPAQSKQGLSSSSLQENLKRRERPSSVQTVSIISGAHSRRSSLQQWSISIPEKSERRDSFNFYLWRELSPSQTSENEDPVQLDWREFHAKLLHNTDAECDL